MTEQEMKDRTMDFGVRVLGLIDALPSTIKGRVVAQQLAKAGTSVGANYRSACRGRSKADFIAKLGIAEEEADESAYWLGMIIRSKLLNSEMVAPLLQEADELTAILAASGGTARRNSGKG
jgi:four helix bundle protein